MKPSEDAVFMARIAAELDAHHARIQAVMTNGGSTEELDDLATEAGSEVAMLVEDYVSEAFVGGPKTCDCDQGACRECAL